MYTHIRTYLLTLLQMIKLSRTIYICTNSKQWNLHTAHWFLNARHIDWRPFRDVPDQSEIRRSTHKSVEKISHHTQHLRRDRIILVSPITPLQNFEQGEAKLTNEVYRRIANYQANVDQLNMVAVTTILRPSNHNSKH